MTLNHIYCQRQSCLCLLSYEETFNPALVEHEKARLQEAKRLRLKTQKALYKQRKKESETKLSRKYRQYRLRQDRS